VGLAMQFLHWIDNGQKLADFPEAQRDNNDNVSFMMVKKDGTMWLYERSPHPYQIYGNYCAIGSGSAYAVAALELGYDAVEAVKLAIKLSPSCGLGIQRKQLQ
jgi:hypothetical protein